MSRKFGFFSITFLIAALLSTHAHAVALGNQIKVESTAQPKAPSSAPNGGKADVKPEPTVNVGGANADNSMSGQQKSSGYGKTHGLLGPVTFGPTISIALPHPANFGLEGRFLDIAGFAFNYGFLPELSYKGAKASMNTWDVRARLFPFRGAFFLGIAYGNQNVKGKRSDVINSEAQTTTLTLSAATLTPHIGWRFVTKGGFTWGFDVGVQLAQDASHKLETDASASQQAQPEFTDMVGDLNNVIDDIEKNTEILPFLTMLHVGYMF